MADPKLTSATQQFDLRNTPIRLGDQKTIPEGWAHRWTAAAGRRRFNEEGLLL